MFERDKSVEADDERAHQGFIACFSKRKNSRSSLFLVCYLKQEEVSSSLQLT